MNAEESLYAELAGHAGTAALVGTRIYPVSLPQTPTLPAITYRLVSQPTEHVFAESASTTKIATFRIQCWAEGTAVLGAWAGAYALATQVEAALDGFSGLLGGAGGITAWVTLTNTVDLGDDETDWKRRILDFEIWGR